MASRAKPCLEFNIASLYLRLYEVVVVNIEQQNKKRTFDAETGNCCP